MKIKKTIKRKKKPQKLPTSEFLNNKIVKELLNKTYSTNNPFNSSDLSKISVEHYLEKVVTHPDKDKIILRKFDNNNNLTDVFAITNLTRVIKNADTQLNINEEEIIKTIKLVKQKQRR